MPTRHDTAVVIRYVRVSATERVIRFYGPFLPHVGSACTTMLYELDQESERSNEWTSWESSIEPVFIAEGESDCKVVATS